MDQTTLTDRLAAVTIVGHVIMIVGTIWLGLSGVIRFEDALDLLPLYVPVLGAYASIMWAYLLAHAKTQTTGDQISGVVVGLGFFLLGTVFFVEIALVFAKALNRISLGQCKLGLAAVETSLAVFLGPLVKRFFPAASPRGTARQG